MTDNTNPLAFLRNQEPFQQMKRLLQQNPNMFGALLRHVGQSNPELFNIIRQNRDAFMLLVNEPDKNHSADGGQERVSFQQQQPLQVPNPLAFLRNQEPFQQMKRLLQQNPNMLGALLRHVGQANPELFNIIRQNRDAFMLLVNEPDQNNSADGGHEGVSLQQQQPLQAQHVAQSGAATTCHMCSRRPTASFILLNCGHLPFCNQCSLFIIRENKNCPICNSSVEGFKKHH